MSLLLVLSSCTSWKQKDFEKELNKAPAEVTPTVVATQEEKKILDKFEVTPVENDSKKSDVSSINVINQQNHTSVKVRPPKKTSSKNKKVEIVKGEETRKEEAQASADYPPELVELNAKGKKVWDVYQVNHSVGEKVYLDIHYMGLTVGKIMVINKGKKMINDKEVWHLHARFKSAPFYSGIYELDDTVDTYVSTENFLSVRYSLIQRESKQDVDDLQLFDRDQLKTFWFYHRKKNDGDVKDKKEEKPIPYFSIDPFSILFFYQGLPLKNGDIYEIPIVNKGKILVLKSQVEGREKIETELGKKSAIRVHATTKYSGETLKSGELYFWFSDDNQRKLLKAQAKIKIGSVTADIVDN